jgi:hypothetical protein
MDVSTSYCDCNAACIMIGEKLADLVRADPAVNPASYEEVLYG